MTMVTVTIQSSLLWNCRLHLTKQINPSKLSPEASSFHMKTALIETSSVKIVDANNDESIVEEVEEITVTVCCMCQNISNQ